MLRIVCRESRWTGQRLAANGRRGPEPELVLLQHHLESCCSLQEGQGQERILIEIAQLGRGSAYEEGAIANPDWPADVVYPLRLFQASLVFGPLYRPAERMGPCPLCLERRWQALRSREEQDLLYAGQPPFVIGLNPRLTPFAFEFVGEVLQMALDGHLPFATARQAESHVYLLNLDTLKLERFLLIADDLCPVCAKLQPDTPEGAVLHLESRPKAAVEAYRLVSPTVYELPLEGLINPLCGVLGARAYRDYSHTVTSPVSGHFWQKGRVGLACGWWGGHGNSYRSSYILAMLEALERYSGFRPPTKRVQVYDSYEHLAPDALDPRLCGLYRPEVYAASSALTAFRPDLPMHWVWGYSLRQARPLLVPEQMVYYLDYHSDSPLDRFVAGNSNGCATGSTLEEAILFGLLELIERDTFLLCWYTKLSPPKIDPWSSARKSTLYLLERISRLGYESYLLDVRLDLPIPAVVAVALRREHAPGKLILAAGASLDPEDAIRAALCEVGAYIAGAEERLHKSLPQVQAWARDFSLVTSMEQHALLYTLPEMAVHARFLLENNVVRSVAETYASWCLQRPHSLDLLDDLRYCLEAVFALGLDVIVVDQTSAVQRRVGLRTVCVIVPGLLPISFGFYRERALELPRLRTVPRIAGYLKNDFDPAQINVTPHPFP